MPLNHTQLEHRLNACDTELSALFEGLACSEQLKLHIDDVKQYYNVSYKKAQKENTIQDIIKAYEGFVKQLRSIKEGSSTYKEMLETINYNHDSRRLGVIAADLAKAAELIFWAATAISLYSGILLVALPMVLVQPTLGIAVSVTIGGLLYKAVENALQRLSEFKSFERHNKGYIDEVSLLTFFKKPESPKEEASDAACCRVM